MNTSNLEREKKYIELIKNISLNKSFVKSSFRSKNK